MQRVLLRFLKAQRVVVRDNVGLPNGLPSGALGLKPLRQLVEMYAVAAFYKDVMVFGAVFFQLGYHFFYIVELAESAVCAGKFGANEPHLVECELRKLVDNGLVRALANGSQFEHVAQNGHLVWHFHIVANGCCWGRNWPRRGWPLRPKRLRKGLH